MKLFLQSLMIFLATLMCAALVALGEPRTSEPSLLHVAMAPR